VVPPVFTVRFREWFALVLVCAIARREEVGVRMRVAVRVVVVVGLMGGAR
jgi:hypothetical protein